MHNCESQINKLKARPLLSACGGEDTGRWGMTASQIIFYIIAGFILGTAILSVTTRKIFRSAIWLLFSLIGVAALFFWMQVEFIAAVQIVVYVGGIVVLIIFSIFLNLIENGLSVY